MSDKTTTATAAWPDSEPMRQEELRETMKQSDRMILESLAVSADLLGVTLLDDRTISIRRSLEDRWFFGCGL